MEDINYNTSWSVVLTSEEVIVLVCCLFILHISICMPFYWLAGKTHTLADHNWSMRKVYITIDRLHDALVEIEKDGKKILDEDFML